MVLGRVRADMMCPRCKKAMREKKRTFHKRRKWVCPRCGKVVMQRPKKRD